MKSFKSIFIPILTLSLPVAFLAICGTSFAQSKKESAPVKVKIVKIVDGDTTTIEKTMDQANVEDFTKQFQNVKGKNVQVMVTVGDDKNTKGRHSSSQSSCTGSGKNKCRSMSFNFDMDSASADSFAKVFSFGDSAFCKKFMWNDSIMKNFPKDFDFKFDFDKDFDFKFDFDDEAIEKNFDFNINSDDNDKTVIIKNKNGKTIIVNGDDDDDNANVRINESENGKSRTKTKTIVITDDKNNTKKKVIVSTSVIVMDMDDSEPKSDRKKAKEEDSFKFYPNPSDGNFVLDLDLNGKDDVAIRITDINGKEVYNEKVSGSGKTSKTINLGDDKKGTFIVTIKQGKKTTSKKIIIE